MKDLKSIITDDLNHCLICGSSNVCYHHCLEGTANRALSDEDNLVVPLEPRLHNEGNRPQTGVRCDVHHCKNMAMLMHIIGQLAWERKYFLDALDYATEEEGFSENCAEEARKQFRKRYGKSYL